MPGETLYLYLKLRLNEYLDMFAVLNENQALFRQGYLTVDPIFSLYIYILLELLTVKRK